MRLRSPNSTRDGRSMQSTGKSRGYTPSSGVGTRIGTPEKGDSKWDEEDNFLKRKGKIIFHYRVINFKIIS